MNCPKCGYPMKLYTLDDTEDDVYYCTMMDIDANKCVFIVSALTGKNKK